MSWSRAGSPLAAFTTLAACAVHPPAPAKRDRIAALLGVAPPEAVAAVAKVALGVGVEEIAGAFR